MFNAREPSADEYREIVDSHLLRIGTSQSDFCRAEDVTPSTLSSVLNGHKPGSEAFLTHLGKKLGFASLQDFKKAAIDRNVFGFDAVSDCLTIGRQRTLWWKANGNGRGGQELVPANISCGVSAPSRSIFTPELQRMLLRVERKFMSGEIPHADKTIYAINRMKTSPQDESGPRPMPVLDMDLVEVPYHACYGLINDIECKEYRRKRIQNWLPADGPIPEVSLGLGINVAIITKDERFVVAKRNTERVGARPGELDIGAVEGVRAEDIKGGKLDVVELAYRAIEEEYDLHRGAVTSMNILGIGYDLFYSQWNFLAVCYVSIDASQIEPQRKAFAIDDYENERTHHLPATPRDVFKFISEQERVWSCALATSFYAMVNLWGSQRVIDETKTFQLKNQAQYHVSRLRV